ncbi:MAG TPA: multicopper oxidase domain-containing protein [Candidatus Methylomirabilis sp.]|nr:multicopper oxidase domain-containing protein [Candidatus Methylomirabilis sp.]
MHGSISSRRRFLKTSSLAVGAICLAPKSSLAHLGSNSRPLVGTSQNESLADYVLHIQPTPLEIAPKRIVSAVTYNGQFPGPLLRFKQGKEAVVDVFNDTDAPEQLHWHGQHVPADVDGAAEEGTPYIPAHGHRRIIFTPEPAGFRFYHTHNRAGANLSAGQYSGQVGPVYIEPRNEPGNYDREIFLTLKEFEPSFSRGGDMAIDFLSPAAPDESLRAIGEASMKASLAKGMPHGFEVGYRSFTINGRMLGHGEPIRVKSGERVLFHVLNGSATEIRSLALPGHTFEVVALDGNPVPTPAKIPVVWLGTAERISAIVEMNHPGVWILGDLDDDDRPHGMGIVVEYASSKGKAQWLAPPKFRWSYLRFAKPGARAEEPPPANTFDMTFAKENAAQEGFNRWTINGVSFPSTPNAMSSGATTDGVGPRSPVSLRLHEGQRYRLRLRNASDDIHPVHLHRHTFELTSIAGQPTAGVMKDVFMLNGYQQAAIDFVADNPGLTLFHCHQQLHMDFGFMTLFDYA